MAHKEPKPDKSLEQIELERRVDQMMDLSLPDPSADQPAPAAAPSKTIDIFHDAKTAPDVSPELLKQVGVESKQPVQSPPPPPTAVKKHRKPSRHAAPSLSIERAVDDIVRAESDELLALEDAAHAAKVSATRSLSSHKGVWMLAGLIIILFIVLFYSSKLI